MNTCGKSLKFHHHTPDVCVVRLVYKLRAVQLRIWITDKDVQCSFVYDNSGWTNETVLDFLIQDYEIGVQSSTFIFC